MKNQRKKNLTFPFRRQLPHGGQPFTGLASVDNQTLKEIKSYDPRFELIQDLFQGVVLVYRVKIYGATSGDDQLVFQCALPKGTKPGAWIIQEMQKADGWKKNGNAQRNTVEYLRATEERQAFREHSIDLKVNELSMHMAQEIVACVNDSYARHSIPGVTPGPRRRDKPKLILS